ncbi:MAG: outer membrane lipoprotein chaperone LolA [Proteobacteria bacterium]|nr:outer membrane lipoprotein chaperone LolA [Pseudomonadota bacterium]
MRRYSFFIALSGCILCSSIFAAEPGTVSEAEGKALVENFVLNIRTLKGRFEQSLVDADNQVVETSSGTLEIQRPGQFRWSYVEPYEQVLVADGLNVWSYDVDLAQVTVKPQKEVLRNTPALLLSGSEDSLDQFEYVGSFSDRGTVWIRLRPKDTDSGFSKVELGFTDGNLSRMMFSDNLEQTTLIALFDVSLNEDIDAERFQFEPPGDVDIVGTPVKVSESDTDDAAES